MLKSQKMCILSVSVKTLEKERVQYKAKEKFETITHFIKGILYS